MRLGRPFAPAERQAAREIPRMPLTNVIEPGHNTDMKRIAQQTLVYCLAFSIALPIGWCCWLSVYAFASEVKAAKPVCCCCKDETTTPKTPAKPTPKAPLLCCCEPMPATTPETFGDYPAIDVSISTPLVSSADRLANYSQIDLTNDAPGPSPPLNLLHCVWLC